MDFWVLLLISWGVVGFLTYLIYSIREKANPFRPFGDSQKQNGTLARKLSLVLQERFPRIQIFVREIAPQLKIVIPVAPENNIEVQVEVSKSKVTVWNEGNSETINLNLKNPNPGTPDPDNLGIELVVDYFDRKLVLQDLTLELGLEGPSHWESWEELDGDEERVIEFIDDFEGRKSMRPIEAEVLADNIVFSLDCLLDSGADATIETKAVVEFIKKNGGRFPLTLQSWLNRSEKGQPAVAVIKGAATMK